MFVQSFYLKKKTLTATLLLLKLEVSGSSPNCCQALGLDWIGLLGLVSGLAQPVSAFNGLWAFSLRKLEGPSNLMVQPSAQVNQRQYQ